MNAETQEYLKRIATPVLQRDLKPELRCLDTDKDGEKDSETVIGYYLPEDQQYIGD